MKSEPGKLLCDSVVLPCLFENKKPSHQDVANRSVLMSELENKQTSVTKDAFSSSEDVIISQRNRKGFRSKNGKEIVKNYSCPHIVDLNHVILSADSSSRQHRPPRIIDGFFPNKIRSAQSRMIDGEASRCYRGPIKRQVGTDLGAVKRDLIKLKLTDSQYKPRSLNSRSTLFIKSESNSKSTINTHANPTTHRAHSCWPVCSSPPWLQCYKVKKRATSSFSLQNPTLSCGDKNDLRKLKRNKEYLDLSNAVIFDAF